MPPDALPVPVPPPAATHVDPAADAAAAYARLSLAPATLRAYRADWDDFVGWCRASGRVALPAAAETVAAYLASLAASHSRAALERRLAAIGAHRTPISTSKCGSWEVSASSQHRRRSSAPCWRSGLRDGLARHEPVCSLIEI